MCGIMEIMTNYLHFIFILFHGHRWDTLLLCRPRAPDSKDNSVHTTAILDQSSDSSLSIPVGDTAFPRALRWALRWALQLVLLLVPPRSPRHPSIDQSCCAVRRWAQWRFSEVGRESRAHSSG